jgi:uncharacterized protein YkwD
MFVMVVMFLSIVMLSAPASAFGDCSGATERTDSEAGEHATRCLINRARDAHGLRRLAVNAPLALAAGRHALDMVERDYFDHTSPGGSTPAQRIWRAGYRGTRIGETIQFAIGRGATAEGAVRGWLDSPPHRRILLDSSFEDIGVGIAQGRPLRRGGAGATAVVDVGGGRPG